MTMHRKPQRLGLGDLIQAELARARGSNPSPVAESKDGQQLVFTDLDFEDMIRGVETVIEEETDPDEKRKMLKEKAEAAMADADKAKTAETQALAEIAKLELEIFEAEFAGDMGKAAKLQTELAKKERKAMSKIRQSTLADETALAAMQAAE